MKMSTLLENDGAGSIELTTTGGVELILNFALLSGLVVTKPNEPRPHQGDLMLFANMICEHRLNPYLGECWLVLLKGKFTPIIAAASRMRVVLAQPDYKGFTWGYIGKDNARLEQGSPVNLPDVIGAWGKVARKDRADWYHEIFAAEYANATYDGYKKWTMLAKVIRDQTHRLAYADKMGNLCTENEAPFFSPGPSQEDQSPQMGSKTVTAEDLAPKPKPEAEATPEPSGQQEATQEAVAEDDKFPSTAAIEKEYAPRQEVVAEDEPDVPVPTGPLGQKPSEEKEQPDTSWL